MDIISLYKDYSITYVTEGHKHCRPGWVQVPCPFCTGNPGYHLGYDTILDRYVCWRCGGHYPPKVIATLLSVSFGEAMKIIHTYGSTIRIETVKKIGKKVFKLPEHTELQINHRTYLERRNFDPDELIQEWNITGTGVYSKVGKIDYKHRILIPFTWDNKIVSFDSRDITNRAKNKYMACEEAREIIPHKHILYGNPKKWGSTVICVEGPTDVWRMGFHSVAVSGIKYTIYQVRILASLFKRIPVLFDGGESQAIAQANKLVADLRFRGVDSFRVDITGDPGSLSDSEAKYLVKQLV